MRVITHKRLKEFWEGPAGRDSEKPLRVWFKETREASWKGPHDIKADYPTASILKRGRVVFNIGGNKFRLVTVVFYDVGIVFIRFIGTHAQYDHIDAQEV
jgi:mRNA interferase HigB